MSDQRKKSSAEFRFFSLLAIVVGLTLLTGTLYGRLTQRWGAPPNLLAAAEHVSDFPEQVGPWQMTEEGEFPEDAIKMLRCAGQLNRQYVNQKTGQSINVAVIVGPPGPTAVHTPEICYSSRAYAIEEEAAKATIDATEDSYWRVRFKSRDVGSQQLRVYYAWGDGEHWNASENPRVEYGGEPLLYKIQLAAVTDPLPDNNLADPCLSFLQSLAESSWAAASPSSR